MMNKRWVVPVLTILIFGLGLSSRAWAQSETTPEGAKIEAVGAATVVTVHGKIVKVDRAHSLVTLQGPAGNTVTVVVKNPDNLRAAKEGEPFAARFYEVVFIRRKKPGENIPAASLSEGIWTAHPNGVPGGSRAYVVRVPVTVDSIDEANGTVTVKASDGSTETVKPKEPHVLKHLKVGEELVVGFYHGIAISLRSESGGGAS